MFLLPSVAFIVGRRRLLQKAAARIARALEHEASFSKAGSSFGGGAGLPNSAALFAPGSDFISRGSVRSSSDTAVDTSTTATQEVRPLRPARQSVRISWQPSSRELLEIGIERL